MQKFLTLAWKFARQHEFSPSMTYAHCALVVKGSKVLGVGYNRLGWSSKQKGKYPARKQNSSTCSVHAEVDSLLKVSNRDEIQGSTVYVIRINRKSELAMSQPCEMCQVILREHGVKKAIFSISNNQEAYGVMKF